MSTVSQYFWLGKGVWHNLAPWYFTKYMRLIFVAESLFLFSYFYLAFFTSSVLGPAVWSSCTLWWSATGKHLKCQCFVDDLSVSFSSSRMPLDTSYSWQLKGFPGRLRFAGFFCLSRGLLRHILPIHCILQPFSSFSINLLICLSWNMAFVPYIP